MRFKDRKQAAELLLPDLKKYLTEDCIVLAIPRGGVPIGRIIANYLKCPLDIFLSKKIGHPSNPEFAIGSVTLNSFEVDREFTTQFTDYLENEIKNIQKTLKAKKDFFSGKKKILEMKNKTVILVDDGIATGKTMIAAIKDLRKYKDVKIVVAVPVSALDAANAIQDLVDEFICLNVSEHFSAISEFYSSFNQVSDKEVKKMLRSG